VIEGTAEVAAAFTRLPFDHLLFTGSTAIGRHVMLAAAENLVPVTLELGGKSPVIIGKSANLAQTTARLAQGKLAFGGQVCVTPDYVLAPADMILLLADGILAETTALYPTIKENDDYTAIINDAHMARLTRLVDDARAKGAKILTAKHGDNDASGYSRKFPMTIILDPTEDMDVMKDEIFGPILPILSYSAIKDALSYVRGCPKPLSAYYFGEDAQEQETIIQSIDTGGLVINDVLCQIFYESIPFGGTGASGMGRYRGYEGFKTFSNSMSVLIQKQAEDMLKMQRPPFGPGISAYFDAQIEGFKKS
jgi:coniferyl-aldehyde dehydrogenase